MKYFHIKILDGDGNCLLKCILEEPTLMVDLQGTILEIAELELLKTRKRKHHVLIPLPKSQQKINSLCLGGHLTAYIHSHIDIYKNITL